MIEIIKPGSTVRIGKGKIEAKVLAVKIEGTKHISYQCSWWDGNSHEVDWLASFEVETSNSGTLTTRIGFVGERN